MESSIDDLDWRRRKPQMDRIRIGRTGLESSVLGLGGGSSGQFGLRKGSRADALRLIATALDLGITLFDGAGLGGGVDEVLAEALGARRREVVLSTKIHLGPETYSTAPSVNRASAWLARRAGTVCSAPVVRRRVEATLRALRTDRLDILHLHAVTPTQYPLAADRVLPELLRMRDEGKIDSIGITEGFLSDPGHAMLALAARDAQLDVVMTGFNLANPSAAVSVLPLAEKANLGVLGMFALRGLGSPDRRQRLSELSRDVGASSVADLAYRYVRHQSGVHVVLTGTGNAEHLRQNLASVSAPQLPADVIERIRTIISDQEGGELSRKW